MSDQEDDPNPPPQTAETPQNRRSEHRRRPVETPWLRSVRLKYGPEVRVLDVSPSGIRFRSDEVLAPKTTIVLEMTGPTGIVLVPARVVRLRRVTSGSFAWYEVGCRFRRSHALEALLTGDGTTPPPG